MADRTAFAYDDPKIRNHLRKPTGIQRKLGASGWSAIWKDNAIGRAWINWVTGGESGPGARPSHPDWFRKIRDDCERNGIAYFHKQHGAWVEGDCDGDATTIWPDGTIGSGSAITNGGLGACMHQVGKKAAGRLLDGREWSEMPR